MRAIFFKIFIIISLFIVFICLAGCPPGTTVPGIISGTCTCSSAQLPLSNVPITVKNSNGNTVDQKETNDNGDYTTEQLESGTYTIEAQRAGYDDYSGQVTVNGDQTHDIVMQYNPL